MEAIAIGRCLSRLGSHRIGIVASCFLSSFLRLRDFAGIHGCSTRHPVEYLNIPIEIGRGYLCCPGTFRSQSGRAKLLYQAPLLKLVREAGSRTGAFSTRNWRATFILLPAEIGGLSESRTLPKDITNPYAAATPIAPSKIYALTILTLA